MYLITALDSNYQTQAAYRRTTYDKALKLAEQLESTYGFVTIEEIEIEQELNPV